MLTFINRLSQVTGLGVKIMLCVEIARQSRCSSQSYGTRLVHRRRRSSKNFVLALFDAITCPQPSEDSLQYGEWKSSECSLWTAPPFPVQVGAPPVHRRCVQPINYFSRFMTATNAHIHQQTLSSNRAGSKEKALCGNRPPLPLQLPIL